MSGGCANSVGRLRRTPSFNWWAAYVSLARYGPTSTGAANARFTWQAKNVAHKVEKQRRCFEGKDFTVGKTNGRALIDMQCVFSGRL